MLPAFLDIAAVTLSSPSKCCKVRVSSTRYRNDPYRAKVLPRPAPSTHVVVDYTPFFPSAAPAELPQQQPVFHPAPAALLPLGFAEPQPQQGLEQQATAFYPQYPVMQSQQQPEAPAVVALDASCPRVFSTRPPSPVMDTRSAPAIPVAAPEILPLSPSKMMPATAAAAAAKAPQQSTGASAEPHFAVVGFKHETATFQAPFRVAVGDVVIVEADRGEHVGVIQSITTTKPSINVPSRILRRANAKEVRMIDELTEKEKKVTVKVQKVAESCGLGIRVVDTEFQMDGNKLTVYFAAKAFVDFRKLQRSLFREFRCRIWFEYWDEVRLYTPVPVNTAVIA